MLNCHDATRLMSQAQEHPLSLGDSMSLRLHVMMCSGCRNFGKQMKVLRTITRAYTQGADGADTAADAPQAKKPEKP
ncbi:MAG: zf-HC2 domain-containing protein [Rhodoferax sp.]